MARKPRFTLPGMPLHIIQRGMWNQSRTHEGAEEETPPSSTRSTTKRVESASSRCNAPTFRMRPKAGVQRPINLTNISEG